MKATFISIVIGSGCALGQHFDPSQITLGSQENAAPYFRVGGGLMWRNIGETNVNPNFGAGPAFFRLPGGVGPENAFGDRTYDNGGFVNTDPGTVNDGRTANYGYQSPTLIGNNLIFTRSGGAAIGLPTGGNADVDLVVAPYLDFSYVIPVREDLEIGLNLNLAFSGIDGAFGSGLAISSVTTVDTYDVSGIVIPNGPFFGSPNSGGNVPLIPNIPASRQQNVAQTGTGQYRFQQDTDLYSLALGSDIRWTPSEKFTFGLGAGVVVNIADWNAQSSNPAVNPATAAIFRNNVSADGREILLGLYLEANAAYRIDKNWSIDGFFRYDWTEDLDASAGATNFTVDLTGWSIGAGVTYRF